MGGAALIAFYAMDGVTAKRAVVRGTVTLAADIGRAIREARAAKRSPIEAVRNRVGAHRLFSAKIMDVDRRTVGGFARGEAHLEGVDGDAGRSFRIQFQNEFLVAMEGDEVMVSTPDLITLLDADTGEPITTESLRFGFRVVALGIPSDPQWRTEAGLALVGPRYFGYDIDYRPVEDRVGA
jgi:hypothetical protein